MKLRILPLQLGITILPIFTHWVFSWAVKEFPFIDDVRSFFFTMDLVPILTLITISPLIVLGLSIYLSIRLWLKFIHKNE